MKVGERYAALSIIGSRFDCAIVGEARSAAGRRSCRRCPGRAWITGVHQHMLEPSDPWPEGYELSDTWPKLGVR